MKRPIKPIGRFCLLLICCRLKWILCYLFLYYLLRFCYYNIVSVIQLSVILTRVIRTGVHCLGFSVRHPNRWMIISWPSEFRNTL